MSKDTSTPGIGSRADWRDPDNYKHLLELDRAGWAWEWLKRNPDFLSAFNQLPPNQPASISLRVERQFEFPSSHRVHKAADSTLARWGVLFRQRFRLASLLVARMQPARPDRRSGPYGCWPRRRLRRPAV